ncbi:hypothetical protein CSKR_202769 [Clonorchis sinensis]|uniref:Uncharacterized protein n=1 Tax=Clonorchis sinensis TaxID=79923 RepID=A0A8T1M362_CLOSI|nr:hypothetical protein CSKR_202769 [Clonorchis sinensis]
MEDEVINAVVMKYRQTGYSTRRNSKKGVGVEEMKENVPTKKSYYWCVALLCIKQLIPRSSTGNEFIAAHVGLGIRIKGSSSQEMSTVESLLQSCNTYWPL